MLFQAMAGRYRIRDMIRHVCSIGTRRHAQQLTKELEARYGGRAVLYHKGRSALAEAIRVSTEGSGYVAISGLTCYSVVQAVESAGCTPVYVDICEDTLQFSAEAFSAACSTQNIKAVVIQNMVGIPADIAGIIEVARMHEVRVIEDLAHSAGAKYADGREIGTVGDVTMISFGKDKALDVVNGGALIVKHDEVVAVPTCHPKWYDQFRDRLYPLIAIACRIVYPLGIGKYIMGAAIRLRLVVRSADGEVDTSMKLPYWQSRLALRQMRELDCTVQIRRENTLLYKQAVANYMPEGALVEDASLIRIPLLVENRNEVIAALAKKGIQVADVWYDVPVSPVRFYKKMLYPEADCPVTVRTAKRLMNVPTHQRVAKRDIETIVTTIRGVAK